MRVNYPPKSLCILSMKTWRDICFVSFCSFFLTPANYIYSMSHVTAPTHHPCRLCIPSLLYIKGVTWSISSKGLDNQGVL